MCLIIEFLVIHNVHKNCILFGMVDYSMNIGIDGFLCSGVGMYVEEGTGHNIVVVVVVLG